MKKTDNNNQGIVYVLTNQAMPGIVKIGHTTRNSIDQRMRELFSTGVPVPFECAFACCVLKSECEKIEKALHTAFAPERVHVGREFFKISTDRVIPLLKIFDIKQDITEEINREIDNDLTGDDKASREMLKDHTFATEIYNIVCELLERHVDVSRLYLRGWDRGGHWSIYLDQYDKYVCRIYLKDNSVAFVDTTTGRVGERIPIDSPEDVRNHKDKLLESLKFRLK